MQDPEIVRSFEACQLDERQDEEMAYSYINDFDSVPRHQAFTMTPLRRKSHCDENIVVLILVLMRQQ